MSIVTLTTTLGARVLQRLARYLADLGRPALVVTAAILALVGATAPATLAILGAAWVVRRAGRQRR